MFKCDISVSHKPSVAIQFLPVNLLIAAQNKKYVGLQAWFIQYLKLQQSNNDIKQQVKDCKLL